MELVMCPRFTIKLVATLDLAAKQLYFEVGEAAVVATVTMSKHDVSCFVSLSERLISWHCWLKRNKHVV